MSQEGFPPGERVELSSLRSANFNFGEGEEQQHPVSLFSSYCVYSLPLLPTFEKKIKGRFWRVFL